jgi:hypothetical protein
MEAAFKCASSAPIFWHHLCLSSREEGSFTLWWINFLLSRGTVQRHQCNNQQETNKNRICQYNLRGHISRGLNRRFNLHYVFTEISHFIYSYIDMYQTSQHIPFIYAGCCWSVCPFLGAIQECKEEIPGCLRRRLLSTVVQHCHWMSRRLHRGAEFVVASALTYISYSLHCHCGYQIILCFCPSM